MSEVKAMQKFGDFAEEETTLEGEKMKIADVFGKEITVAAYEISPSKLKGKGAENYLKLQFLLENETHVLFTSSAVLIKQIEKYKEHIPFISTIQKIKDFYAFT